jgi:hypothetical protein
MKKLSGILLLTVAAAIMLGASVTGCDSYETTQPVSPTKTISTISATPITTTPISATPASSTIPPTSISTLDQEARVAADFIQSSSTYRFDGIEGSLVLVNSGPGWSSAFYSNVFIFDFRTAHPGHGDRSGQVLAQVITPHTAVILVASEKREVASAVCDKHWDMLHEKELPVTLTGTIISGGDTTPADGPLDAPRTLVYLIQKSDGTYVNVSYTAYPPSPAGKEKMSGIKLEFAGGAITPGDQMEACGSYDSHTNTLKVAEPGNYIRTSLPRLTVIGKIVSGGDAAPADGPPDVPHKFVYTLEQDDRSLIDVSYTSYPPSPTNISGGVKIGMSLYDSSIKIGDYMKAHGTLDKSSHTVMLTGPDDFLKTYPLKP